MTALLRARENLEDHSTPRAAPVGVRKEGKGVGLLLRDFMIIVGFVYSRCC